MTPLKLLEKTLNSMERDLKKSQEAFTDGKIGKRTYELHYANLSPKIAEYREVIKLLNQSI
jgi:hypothetical protein